ncbi:MAG TPA: VWA domain-containing protein [Vicinamibacterales bacterium]|nr:VWA domain-containing protein [Vicinamibacterales bacterium]
MSVRPIVRRGVLGVVLAAVACLPLIAQSRQTFRTATRLVEVSVVVTDRLGAPVTGLTKAEFSLEEDGQAQAISFFEVRDDRAAPPSLAPSRGPEPAPNTFSNVLPPGPGTATVILLDRLNAGFDSQWFARKHIEQYLGEMRPGDRVALYVLDGTVRVLHDFSTSASSLRRALEIYQARVSGHYDASMEPPPDMGGIASWLVDPALSSSDFFQQRRSVDTFKALEELAQHLAGIGGRKSIVWLSEVFPLSAGMGRQEVLERMRHATRALSHAQASLYPVDARGLVGAMSYRGGRASFNSLGMIRGNIDTMEIVAEETGGRAFANSNALAASIRRAVNDSRHTYVLGYYPSSTPLDGRFRKIAVHVARRGVKVRHRAGYLAAPSPGQDARSRDTAMRAALQSPLQTTGVGLSAGVTRAGDDLTLSIRLDLATLTLERDGVRWRGAADVVIAQVLPSGKGQITAAFPVALSLTDDERNRAGSAPLTIERTITLQPKMHHLRVVARDVTTGSVGSVVIPVRAITTQ